VQIKKLGLRRIFRGLNPILEKKKKGIGLAVISGTG